MHNVVDFLEENKRIWSLVKFILVMPATNASSEHAFSALKRVKSYLGTSMLINRFNNLMTCAVHKELVEELNFYQVTNDFVDIVERHSSILATFPLSSNRCG